MVDKTEFKITPNDDEEEFAVDFGEVIKVGGGGGTSDFNALTNRPKYNNSTMTGNTNIPQVPSKTSELTNDSDYQTETEVTSAINTALGQIDIPTKTSDLTNDGADGTSTYVEADDLATVATSGSYNDLNNKPTIPAAQVNSDWNADSGVAQILNKPTIPTVNDATLTITQNGISKGTFTANDDTDTTIEVSDTTYSNFTGTDGNTGGTSGLVPAPTTTDADKFLKSDGTWATTGGGGGGVTVVQTTGTSQTDVMSQDATTKLVYPNIANYPYKMLIGEGYVNCNKGLAINGRLENAANDGIAIGMSDASPATIGQAGRAFYGLAIGRDCTIGRGDNSVVLGYQAYSNSGQNTGENVAIGHNSYAGNSSATSTVALGAYAKTTRTGEVNIGTGSNGTGYNSTNYRVLGGVHDGQLAQDAATVAQVNATIDAINTALSTNIPHIGA